MKHQAVRLDDFDDLEVVYAREARVVGRNNTVQETLHSPQKGRTHWTVETWNIHGLGDLEVGLDDQVWDAGDFDGMDRDEGGVPAGTSESHSYQVPPQKRKSTG